MDVVNRRVFNRFVRKYIHLSEKSYFSFNELRAEEFKADLYLTGSDQVWNSFYNVGVDPAFYLSFVKEKGRKVSFAASFGRGELPSAEAKEIRPYLSEYQLVSVREQSAVGVMERMGMRAPERLLDPTLLLSGEEWKIMFPPRQHDGKYVLVYQMKPMPQLFTIARRIAEKIGAEVWFLSAGMKIRKDCDKTVLFKSPEEFVPFISQAAFVVTNSFHGTAFSINLHRPFVSLVPDEFGTRITGLLDTVGLADRMYDEKANIDNYLRDIDYKRVERILSAERQKADDFIEKALNLP